MNNLNEEQKKDCEDRIKQANEEIAEICKRLQVQPIISSVQLNMGDVKYRSVETPLPLNDLVNHETPKEA